MSCSISEGVRDRVRLERYEVAASGGGPAGGGAAPDSRYE